MLLKEKHSVWRNNENLRQRNRGENSFKSKYPLLKLNIISSRRNSQTFYYLFIESFEILWNQNNSIENHIVSRSLRFFLGFSWLLDISMKKPRKIPSSPAANWVMKRRLWFNVGNKEKVGLFLRSRQNQLERNGFRIVNLPCESWLFLNISPFKLLQSCWRERGEQTLQEMSLLTLYWLEGWRTMKLEEQGRRIVARLCSLQGRESGELFNKAENPIAVGKVVWKEGRKRKPHRVSIISHIWPTGV